MGFKITAAQDAQSFDKVPTGMYQARLDEVTEPEYYDSFPDPKTGKTKKVPKSRFIFEITFAQEAALVGEKISKFVNMDGHGEKSGMYGILVGLGLDPDLEYDTDELLGRICQLFVVVAKNKAGVSRSNIDKVLPVPGQPKLGKARVVAEAAPALVAQPF